MQSRASVVIPTKNRGRYVTAAIRSALNADSVGQVVVVDDDSTDDTRVVLDRLAGEIEIVRGNFGSPAAARNAGAARATYPLLAFLDSDDEMFKEKVTCLAGRFDDSDIALVHGSVDVIDATGEVDHDATAIHRSLFHRGAQVGTDYVGLANFCGMFTSATLIRADAFREVGGYDESLTLPYEDLDLYLRLSLRWRLVYDPCVVARYRVWPGNFGWKNHAEGSLAVGNKHLSLIDEVLAPSLRSRARFGFLRRMAVSSQTLGRGSDTRRYLAAAAKSQPSCIDTTMLRLFVASLLPKRIIDNRRRR